MQCLRWLRRLFLVSLLAMIPALSHAAVMISVTITPPVLPVYEQPMCPEAGLIWVPGYWAWGDEDYYWVPGEWVPAPFEGALWTPPYWGWDDGRYVFYSGYWGTTVGYYGGIDYGFGYMGVGYVGGMWRGGVFEYNTAVTRVDPAIIRNTYVDRTIVEQNTIVNSRRVAYNGGPGGVQHQPTAMERTARNERHTQSTAQQQASMKAARADRTSYAKYNGGHPRMLVATRSTESAHFRAGMAERKVEPPERKIEPRGPAAAARTEPRSESSAGRTEQPSPEARKSPERWTPGNRSEPASRSEVSPRSKSTNSSSARATEERHSVSGAAAGSESHPLEEPKPETRAAAPHAQTESRPAPATHAESRPESRPTAQPESRHRSEPAVEHPTESHPRSTAHPQPESRPIPQERSHPAIVSHPEPQPHAAQAPKEESHPPKPEAHAAPPPKGESHPVPETHPRERPREPQQR